MPVIPALSFRMTPSSSRDFSSAVRARERRKDTEYLLSLVSNRGRHGPITPGDIPIAMLGI